MSHEAEAAHREGGGVGTKPVVLSAIGILAFLLISVGAGYFYVTHSLHGRVNGAAQTFAEPRLQASPAIERNAIQQRDERRLAGPVSIDDAMRIIAERGQRGYLPLAQQEAQQ